MSGQELDGAQGDASLDQVGAVGVAQAVDVSVQVAAAQGAHEGAAQARGGDLWQDVAELGRRGRGRGVQRAVSSWMRQTW
jgi:hypothetical protein